MIAYIIRRLLLVIPTVIIVTVVVFAGIRVIPGSVLDAMVGSLEDVTAMDREMLERELGLDQPVHIQYFRWVGDLFLRGDLGKSLWRETPVIGDIINALPVTIELTIIAMATSLFIGITTGIYSALRQDTAGDYAARSFAILCIALPPFWVATLVIYVSSVFLGNSPSIRVVSFVEEPFRNLAQFIVPGVVLGLSRAGSTMRMTRTMMLEVQRQDYVRTAWAKGLKEKTIVLRHSLKNALIPVITLVALQVEATIGGAVVVEQIFGLPGIGRLLIDATNIRDYPVISGMVLGLALLVMVVSFR